MRFEGLDKIEDNINQLERKAIDDLCSYYGSTKEYQNFTKDALRSEMAQKLQDIISSTLSYKEVTLKARRAELNTVKDASTTEYIDLERDTTELYAKELNFIRKDLTDKLLNCGIREQVVDGIVKAVVRMDIQPVKSEE